MLECCSCIIAELLGPYMSCGMLSGLLNVAHGAQHEWRLNIS